ncbi:hypothetical protein M501DRAFT_1000864 [Patellaria atrata CBS 101060]|uniref:Uncharacterized protein n=1 Tax=Patellaria atrata CBS 101060 TaxID=1346257 RepID=A0A9P4SFT2_9PEZI|nr:hypothetical protein M501DRAFT_1000864 [Patellaria atrata CBS 101060]
MYLFYQAINTAREFLMVISFTAPLVYYYTSNISARPRKNPSSKYAILSAYRTQGFTTEATKATETVYRLQTKTPRKNFIPAVNCSEQSKCTD